MADETPWAHLDRLYGLADQADNPEEPPKQDPSTAEQWLGKDSFIGTAADTLGRLGSGAENLISAGGNLVVGNTDKAGDRFMSALKGLPGMVGGAADLVGGRLGAPSAREYIDEKVGFTDADRMTGQKLLKESGAIERDDNPLLSVPGALGLGIDILTDPTAELSSGKTALGKLAEKAGGIEKYTKELNAGRVEAQRVGDLAKVKQLDELLTNAPKPIPNAPKLAASRGDQVRAGQRALLQFGDTPLVKGAGVYDMVDKAGKSLEGTAVGQAFHHGAVTQAASKAQALIQQGEDDIHKMRQAWNELSTTADPAKRAKLEQLVAEAFDRNLPQSKVGGQAFAKSVSDTFSPQANWSNDFLMNALEKKGVTPPEFKAAKDGLAEMYGTWRDVEKKLHGNVGSGTLQLTPENKALLSEADRNVSSAMVIDELNKVLPAHKQIKPTSLRQALDAAHRAGIPTTDLNKVLENAGVVRPNSTPLITTNLADVTYMRAAQHMRAQGVNEYINGMLGQNIARKAAQGQFKFPAQFGDQFRSYTMFFDSPEHAKLAKQSYDLLFDPQQSSALVRFIDKFNGVMKHGVTRMFPEFHVRNTLSNRFQSYLEGVPLTGEFRDEAAAVMAGKNVGVNIGGKTFSRDELLREFNAMGGSKGGYWEAALSEAAPKGAPPGKLQKLREFGEGVMATPAAMINGTAAKVGLGKVSGQLIEDTDRLAHYIWKRREGLDPRSAAQSMDRALFNYSKANLTPFEQKVMNRAVLFYGYQRNVIPFILEKALEAPGKVNNMLRLGNSGGHPVTPPYLDDQGKMGLPKDFMSALKGGEPRQDAVATGLPTPIEAAGQMPSMFDDGALAGLRGVLGTTSPLIKAPIELATGDKLYGGYPYSNKPPKLLQQMLGVQAVPPWLNTLMENVPTARAMKFGGQIGDTANGKTSPWDLMSKLGGVSVSSFNPDEQVFRQAAERIRPQLEAALSKGWVTKSGNSYRLAKTGSPPPRIARLLALYENFAKMAAKVKSAPAPTPPVVPLNP